MIKKISMLPILIVSLFFGACSGISIPAPTPTHTPLPPTSTSTYTPTPTYTPTLSPLPSLTPTLTPIDFPFDELPGMLAFVDFNCPGFGICSSISISRLDFSGYETVSEHERGIALDPLWSPDGRYIAYELASLGEEGGYFHIYVYDFRSKKNLNLTPQGFLGILGMAWSPDSRHIVFGKMGESDTESDIYRIDVRTHQLINLTPNSPGRDEHPAWSPDGKKIAFVSDRSKGVITTDNIWVMNTNGSNPKNLTPNDELGWDETKPEWSPDSRQIAYYRFNPSADQDAPGGPGGLWRLILDSGNEKLLHPFSEDPYLSNAPAWSPQGDYIAFNFGEEEAMAVWLVWADGYDAHQISEPTDSANSPSWSPDSRALVFSRMGSNQVFLYVLDTNIPFWVSSPSGVGHANWSPQIDDKP